MGAKRLQSEVVVLGNGCAALFATTHLLNRGYEVILINPQSEFSVNDIACQNGLSLWDAAYRTSSLTISLTRIWDDFMKRLKEALPVSIDEAAVMRSEHWSLFSSTPVHQNATIGFEQEYFRLERKPWTVGQVRLVNPDYVDAKFKALGLRLSHVASVEGAMVRQNAIWWDAHRIGRALNEFVWRKSQEGRLQVFTNAELENKVGRRLVFSSNGQHYSLEHKNKFYVILTGDLVPHLKGIIQTIEEPWIQGLRKRRREQHNAHFQRRGIQKANRGANSNPLWLEIGAVSYRWDLKNGWAHWTSKSGPDSLESVIDEGLRMEHIPSRRELGWIAFSSNQRHFKLEWEWKNPQWRNTAYDTHWATAFEGSLWSIMELLWTIPTQ